MLSQCSLVRVLMLVLLRFRIRVVGSSRSVFNFFDRNELLRGAGMIVSFVNVSSSLLLSRD